MEDKIGLDRAFGNVPPGDFKIALAHNPDYPEAHNSLGMVLAREGQYREAVPHLTKAIELGGAEGITFGLLGFCHLC